MVATMVLVRAVGSPVIFAIRATSVAVTRAGVGIAVWLPLETVNVGLSELEKTRSACNL